MTISDERLAELASAFSRTSIELTESGMDGSWDGETAAALRELQAARELLATLAAQWSGEICSTKRSDCMAVLARVHLRHYGQAHD